MNKGRKDVHNFSVLKTNWEITKNISEILKFNSDIISCPFSEILNESKWITSILQESLCFFCLIMENTLILPYYY